MTDSFRPLFIQLSRTGKLAAVIPNFIPEHEKIRCALMLRAILVKGDTILMLVMTEHYVYYVMYQLNTGVLKN